MEGEGEQLGQVVPWTNDHGKVSVLEAPLFVDSEAELEEVDGNFEGQKFLETTKDEDTLSMDSETNEDEDSDKETSTDEDEASGEGSSTGEDEHSHEEPATDKDEKS